MQFHDGQPLTARDVKWTFDSLITGKIRSSKTSTYSTGRPYRRARRLHRHLSSEGAVRLAAVEPVGWRHRHRALRQRRGLQPASDRLGTISFRQRAAGQRGRHRAQPRLLGQRRPSLSECEFKVIPDATTRALELRKHSADVAINALTADTVLTLRKRSRPHGHGSAGNHLCVSGAEPARSDPEGCSRAPRDRLRHRRAARSFTTCCATRRSRRTAFCRPQHWAYDGDVDAISA